MHSSRRSPGVCRLWAVLVAALGVPAAAAMQTAPDPELPPGYELTVVPISGPLGLMDISVQVGEHAPESVYVLYGMDGRDRFALRREHGPGGVRFDGRLMLKERARESIARFAIGVQFSVDGELSAYGPFEFSAEPPEGQRTPDWAKGAVWYQIFPERFRNGNPGNDPSGPAFTKKDWTSNWYGFDVEELESARARVTLEPPHLLRALPDPRGAAMQARRYGGDLEGVTQKLDELADLGVTAIYLNPVFKAHSHHKYDATDFRHIDPTFAGAGDGGEEEAAAIRGETDDPATWAWTGADRYVVGTLLPEIHERGMRVVFDGVWNHVGTRFWAFADVMQRGRDSRYAEWFQVEFADAERLAEASVRAMDVREGSLIAWKSWNGVNGTLPTFARSAEGRLHPEVERHIFEVTKRWMAPELEKGGSTLRGIDGWRLDVAPDLPRPFWEAWAAHARVVNPNAVLLGEFWFDAREYFSGGNGAEGKDGGAAVFDGQMNYPVAMPLVRWLADDAYTSEQLGAQLERVLDRPAQHELVQMNLLGSHDTARVATMIEAGLTEYGGQIPQRVQRMRPRSESYDKVVLGVAMLACWPGSPMVYYGDEYGMHGGNDPHCRKPLPWADAGLMAREEDRAEPGLREKFRAWLRLRQDPEIGDVLRYGDVRIIETGNKGVFAFERGLSGKRVVMIANKGDKGFDASAVFPTLEWQRLGRWPRLLLDGPPAGTIQPRSAVLFELSRLQ